MPPSLTRSKKRNSTNLLDFSSGFSSGFSKGYAQGYHEGFVQAKLIKNNFDLWESNPDGSLRGSFARPAPDSNKPMFGIYAGTGPKLYQRSDDKILEDIYEELTQHPDIDPSEVIVSVKNGIVNLTGAIATLHMKEAAYDAINRVLGVKKIYNDLRIDTTIATKSASSQSAAESALSKTV